MTLAPSGSLFWSPRQAPGSDWMDYGLPSWTADAACREHRELEFVLLPQGAGQVEIEKRKAICRCCLVRQECLAYALENDEVGIRGGTTDRERRELRKAGLSALGPTNRSA